MSWYASVSHLSKTNFISSGESTIDGTTADQYANESFESEVSEVKTQESLSTVPDGSQSSNHKEMPVQLPSKIDSDYEARLPKMSERTNKYPGVTIKVPLSPRLQRVQRRRYSSGSDDSVILSQTGSDILSLWFFFNTGINF